MPLFRSTPRDDELLALLDAAGENVRAATVLLRDCVEDWPEHADRVPELLACEHEGDRITHDVIYRLKTEASSGRLPLDPTDGLALASALDDVVDYAEQTADQLVIYGVEAPMEQADGLTAVLVAAGDEVAHAVRCLRDGADPSAHLVEIHRLENEGDRLSRDAIGSLFANGIDPMVVIRWKDIFDSLESAVDACETVAHVLEGIALRQG